MGSGELFVSFWHVGLQNIPEGKFVHRRVAPEAAKQMIEEACAAGTLRCASADDLFAPYNKHESDNHEKLCRVLSERYGIELSFRGPVGHEPLEEEDSCVVCPLALVEVAGPNRLMIVDCHYVMGKQRKKGELRFDIDPESVRFHLLEAMAPP